MHSAGELLSKVREIHKRIWTGELQVPSLIKHTNIKKKGTDYRVLLKIAQEREMGA